MGGGMIDRRPRGRLRIGPVDDGSPAGLHSVVQHIFGASLELNNAVLPCLDGEAASRAALAIDELEAAMRELRQLALVQRAADDVGTFSPTARAAQGG
jgi:hypothetical protein